MASDADIHEAPAPPTQKNAPLPISGEQSPQDGSATQPDRPWQERLLPLMVRMIVGLTLFFFIASFVQLAYLHLTIQQAPRVDYATLLQEQDPERLSVSFQTLAVLDAGILERRYHQANVLLMSRVWARYLGFVTGMILALVGAVFILGKLREETSEVSAEGTAGSLSLRSSSPGLVMTVLGVALMVTTIVTHHEIQTADSPVYLRLAYEKPAAGPAAPTADPALDSLPVPPPDFP